MSVALSLLFFFVTNFGVWMASPLYPPTLQGLGLCYLAGIPFLAHQILGDLVYGLLLFGYSYLLARLFFPLTRDNICTKTE